jgi:probable rRNA maturation factor
VDDAAIARLNADYRGTPRPTDVLSFSQIEGAGPEGGHLLGDVVISVETARRQARERGRPLDEEVAALLVHGVLHLLGYDHERSAAGARAMFAREREVAAAAGLPALALGDRPRRPGRPARAVPRRRAQGGQA